MSDSQNGRSSRSAWWIGAIGTLLCGALVFVPAFAEHQRIFDFSEPVRSSNYPKLLSISIWWGSAAFYVFAVGLVAASIKPRRRGIWLAVLVWAATGSSLFYVSPYQWSTCVSAWFGHICDHRRDLVTNLVWVYFSLGFPALLAVSLDQQFLVRMARRLAQLRQ